MWRRVKGGAAVGREFICKACGKPCVEGAAEAAAVAKFGDMKQRQRGDVCDPCFLLFLAEVTEVFYEGEA
jgi:hypothetical protein